MALKKGFERNGFDTYGKCYSKLVSKLESLQLSNSNAAIRRVKVIALIIAIFKYKCFRG